MEPIRRILSNRQVFITLVIFQVVAVFVLTSVSVFPKTKIGVQCPTAAVQVIRDTVVERTNSGQLETETILRAPRPGDKDFKQCCCAEKRAGKEQLVKESGSEGQRLTLIATTSPTISFSPRLIIGHRLIRLPSNLDGRRPEPQVPPPNVI
ncbi:MAG: hypothetical protein JST51_14650 [Armatimonadetes bacterium]|nr:hypothetical protein [Armatimonadota bacterium]